MVGSALWITLLIYGALLTPVPDVNESHYLGKAKHFWDPNWCAGDLLLESSNAHAVFYVVMGTWAKWLSLPQLAWCGRAVGYGLLAWGWQRTHEVLQLTRWLPWWSLMGFLSLATWGNFSGEWLVGGIEGKVFSYGCLLLAFADWQSQQTLRAAVWGGLAISFHPLAGGWAVLAAVLTEAWDRWRYRQRLSLSDAGHCGLIFTAALPGLIPAVQLLAAADPPSVRVNGTYLQVYYRLQHHLDPMTFSVQSYGCYLGLCLVIGLLIRFLPRTKAGTAWLRIAGWAAVFALCGLAAGFGPRPAKLMPYYLERMNLLKFYPFRLFDVLIPLTAAIQGTALISQMTKIRPVCSQRAVCIVCLIGLLIAITGGEFRRLRLQQPTVFDNPAWIDACHWIRDHTPPTALVQTPVQNRHFKWYAERAEYVAYKDVPQDNAGLVEWNRRMLFLNQWYQHQRQDGVYSNEELRQLRSEIGITHILTDRLGPFELPPCYTNALFRVYDLTKLGPSS